MRETIELDRRNPLKPIEKTCFASEVRKCAPNLAVVQSNRHRVYNDTIARISESVHDLPYSRFLCMQGEISGIVKHMRLLKIIGATVL